MRVGVLEVEGLDPSGVRVPVRQPLRPARRVPHAMLAQPRVGPVHVRHDDGDVLEAPVVGPRVRRNRAPFGGEVFDELDLLASETHPGGAHAQAEHSLQPLPRFAGRFVLTDLLEGQDLPVEGDRPVEVRDDDRDGVHAGHQRRTGRERADRRQKQADAEKETPEARGPDHFSLSFRCSPTRRALAMMVSAGLTAADDGKKLPSTT